MRILARLVALFAVVGLAFGLAQTSEAAGESSATSLARQGPRRLARSEGGLLATSSDQAVAVQEKQAVETAESSWSSRKRKRCYYVRTFFHRIDCNAPANSTSIPYSHAPEATAKAV
ncbi:hypothetical protein RTBOTA2_003757 [Rhodotorula toruloides]|uniref:Secreted protein n=1 Tax=Rhodotorula toruloides TaxID=5286 RepID=A0A0K3C9B4_RHOTO|nr:hypothetical protein RTBOTA2_003757 [Rhodotorula toruloides]